MKTLPKVPRAWSPKRPQNRLLKTGGVNMDEMKATTPPEITNKHIWKAATACFFLDIIGLPLVGGFPVLATWFRGGLW
jgi:hypothetical protein